MSSFFKNIAGGVENVQKDYLGPTYLYHKQIKSPNELGMSPNGDMGSLTRDIAGIVNYTAILVSGKSSASKTGKALGNKFFLKTGGTCEPNDKKGNSVDRYLYINNVPDGSIPFISSGLGQNFSTFKGIIPGIMGNISEINPLEVIAGVSQKSKPPCRKVTLETIDVNNRKSSETHYVADMDLANLSGCNFPNSKNPVTGKVTSGCSEGFELINKLSKNDIPFKLDMGINVYNVGFSILLLYLLFSLQKKN